MSHAPARFGFVLAGSLAAAFGAGCGGASHDRYIPQAEQARGAVEAALDAWKAGAPQGTIADRTPKVDFYDARRREGKKLREYSIVEEVPGDPHPSFKAILRFAGAEKGEETKYLVIGIDPLNVFRAEDYKRATGM